MEEGWNRKRELKKCGKRMIGVFRKEEIEWKKVCGGRKEHGRRVCGGRKGSGTNFCKGEEGGKYKPQSEWRAVDRVW